ncbi:6-bladed beta-propeller [Candidatus Palauibacter sp.]|uniref:6-bladed beta-propeller n=1 Tax=Candidatus Palauibacter sp. TaxID=3101350 RepID=UPI003B52EC4C
MERTVTIGAAVGVPEAEFTSVGAVVVSGNRLIVGQPMERNLRLFATTGEFVRSLGGPGEGPGEFEAVGEIGLTNGMLWVWDGELNRLQYFDGDGDYRYVSGILIRGHPAIASGNLYVTGVLADGSILARVARESSTAAADPRAARLLLLLDSKGILRDTAAVLHGLGPASEISDGLQAGRRLYVVRPVFDRSLLDVWPDGSGFVVVHRESAKQRGPHTYRVIKFSAEADTAFALNYPYDPVPISDSWLSREVRKMEDAVSDDDRNRGGILANRRRLRGALREAFGRLNYFPAVVTVEAAANGTTWLHLRTGPDSFVWQVLDDVGHPIGRFEEPPGGWLVAGDLNGAWFVERDEFEVPYLVRYEFRDR